jgi:hypothetical protein
VGEVGGVGGVRFIRRVEGRRGEEGGGGRPDDTFQRLVVIVEPNQNIIIQFPALRVWVGRECADKI